MVTEISVDTAPAATATVDDGVVCIIGGGYVGLVTAAALAESGRQVRILDVSDERLEVIRNGGSPIYEPGLDELVATTVAEGSLTATTNAAIAMAGAGIAVIAVGTPPSPGGGADLSQVRAAIIVATAHAGPGCVLVLKSTVPPGTTAAMQPLLRRERDDLTLIACPEFLREGCAIDDVRSPARLVVGGDDAAACQRVVHLFGREDTPTMIMDAASAEMIKYGSNAFLALKISFINEIAHLCELTGAEVDRVADGIGADPRIGRAFLDAGVGFGGSCFPKDVGALEDTAGRHGQSFWLLRAATEVNMQQRRRIVSKVELALGGDLYEKRIAVLGIAFKPGTDDTRQAPAIDIIQHLLNRGATVVATDPMALETARGTVGAELVADTYECVRDADAVVVLTDWEEFGQLDWDRIASTVANRLVVDGRNCLDHERLTRAGFTYLSVGRSPRHPSRGPVNPPLPL